MLERLYPLNYWVLKIHHLQDFRIRVLNFKLRPLIITSPIRFRQVLLQLQF
jgi:hypothetical protein